MGLFSFLKGGTTSKVKQMSVEQLKAEMKSMKDKQFIDVRTKDEFREDHIRNFENIPLNNLPNRLEKFSKEKETYVICRSGGRSAAACRILQKAGFENIANIQGGMMAWDRVKKN